MPDDDGPMAVLGRLEAKIDSLEARLARQVPMTPGRAAAEARQAMAAGYQAEAEKRAAAKAAKAADAEEGDDE
jgi:hypothetical protein